MDFSKILTNWYSVNKRNLPWRETQNPYHIWLSEIILQQTQINQGLPYYRTFIEHFPTVFDLAKSSEDKVLKLWQGLGYYSRARNLHHAAKTIVEEYQGEFPKTYIDIIKLKGVGDYTASAIASICYNEKTAVVDGNVYRLLSRYFGIETPINSGKGIKEFKTLAQTLLPQDNIGDYNQAVMEFGSKQCKPKNPDCTVCPFERSCVARQNNQIEFLPVKLKKAKTKLRYFNYLVFLSNDTKTLMEQRKGKGIWQNLYQFPLIESDKALTLSVLLKQSKFKEIIQSDKFQISLYNDKDIIHKLSHQHLHTKFWIVQVEGSLKNAINFDEAKSLAMPILISNFLDSFNY